MGPTASSSSIHARQVMPSEMWGASVCVCASSLHAQALTHGRFSMHGVYIEAVCICPEEGTPPGIEPMLPALGAHSLSRWTTREVPAMARLTQR